MYTFVFRINLYSASGHSVTLPVRALDIAQVDTLRSLDPALSSRERNVSTPSGSWEFSSTRGYRWETTSQKILNTCSSSTYALRVLRSDGLQPNELHLVARATTVASILYAPPAWYGFANEGDRKRLERLIARMRRCGYLPRDFPSLAALVDEADRKLFRSISHNPTHVLYNFYNFRVSNIRVSNRTLIYNVCPEAAPT